MFSYTTMNGSPSSQYKVEKKDKPTEDQSFKQLSHDNYERQTKIDSMLEKAQERDAEVDAMLYRISNNKMTKKESVLEMSVHPSE